MAYRNLVRLRFNYDDASPAQMLGFAPRRFTETEVLGGGRTGARGAHTRSRLDSRGRSAENR
jgi:hypothetical protein